MTPYVPHQAGNSRSPASEYSMEIQGSLRNLAGLLIAVTLLLMVPGTVGAFSVLGHQAAVDQAWDYTLLRLLRQRFPHATPQVLADAHAYARGGSHLADRGIFRLAVVCSRICCTMFVQATSSAGCSPKPAMRRSTLLRSARWLTTRWTRSPTRKLQTALSRFSIRSWRGNMATV